MASGLRQEVILGDALYDRGFSGEARRLYEKALQAVPGAGIVWFKLATCHWSDGDRYAALRALEKAATLEPTLACAQEWLGQWYLQEGMGEAAWRHSLMAVRLAPGDASALTSHAFVLEAAGELDRAWAVIEKLVSDGYCPPRAVMLHSRLAHRFGKSADALKRVEQLLAKPTKPAELKSLHFTAAELLDHAGRYDHAFAHAEQANQIGRKPWDAARFEAEVERLIGYFTPERVRSVARTESVGDQAVFIVGMPRSGTSLVEQIIASHPQAHGGGELDFIHQVRKGTIGMLGAMEEQFPMCLDRLSADQAIGLAEVYLEPLKAMSPGAVRITDKMPLNFMHLGLISLLLPEARVIHCRRDAMDTCLSCFMTHFTAGHEFTSDLQGLAKFYRSYSRLMRHWKSVLPLAMTEISYEALVHDPKREVGGVLEFLRLPWDRKCLRFYEEKRFVTTASVEQVRRPIYTSSVGRWRKYEKFFGRLEEKLRGS